MVAPLASVLHMWKFECHECMCVCVCVFACCLVTHAGCWGVAAVVPLNTDARSSAGNAYTRARR